MLVSGSGVGVSPSKLSFSNNEEKHLFIINQNENPIEFEIDVENYIFNAESFYVDAFGKVMITLFPDQPRKEEILTVHFHQDSADGIGLQSSVSVRLFHKKIDKKKAKIKSIGNSLFSEAVRNLGPVLSFVIIIAGIFIYVRLRPSLG
tara:strand:+ start:212 stop:655 length:444 start_codon:yes stop_codon:yes gene_type:complete